MTWTTLNYPIFNYQRKLEINVLSSTNICRQITFNFIDAILKAKGLTRGPGIKKPIQSVCRICLEQRERYRGVPFKHMESQFIAGHFNWLHGLSSLVGRRHRHPVCAWPWTHILRNIAEHYRCQWPILRTAVRSVGFCESPMVT